MQRNARRTLLLLLVGTVFAMVLAEAGAWLAFRRSVDALAVSESDLFYYFDPAGKRRLIPSRTGYARMWNDDGKAEFVINALGFRGPEISLEKPAGVARVLFLGDSITFGSRTPLEDTFVDVIRRRLEREEAGRYEVINGAVADIGLAEEEEVLREKGIGIAPDLVVLGWYLNDARPPVGFPEETIYRNPVIRWFERSALLRHSYFAGMVYESIRQALISRQVALMERGSVRFGWVERYKAQRWRNSLFAFDQLVDEARFDWGDGWNADSRAEMFERIREMRDFVEDHDARFALIAFPAHPQVETSVESPLVDEPQRALAMFAREEAIPLLDILPALKPRVGEHLFWDQCHYTPHGNQIVGDVILKWLRETGLLQGSDGGSVTARPRNESIE